MSEYPVSETCPACGAAEHTTTPSQAKVSYGPDRVCRRCGTRYTPPTPRWAAITFLLAGVVLVALAGYGFVAGSIPWAQRGLLVGMGLAASGFGLAALRRPKDQSPPPPDRKDEGGGTAGHPSAT